MPPIVLDEAGVPVEGREVLVAIIEADTTLHHPIITDATPAVLAEIDQRMARISDELGVPIYPASETDEDD